MARVPDPGSRNDAVGSVQMWGEWRRGPWMATRTSRLYSNGFTRRRPLYVAEVKIPGKPYATYVFRWKWYRDAWAAIYRCSPPWRSAVRYAEEMMRARRKALLDFSGDGSTFADPGVL